MAESITIARPYTKAAFEIALEQDDLSGWSAMLSLASAIVSDQQMQFVLDNPAIGTRKQAQILINAHTENQPLSTQAENFVYLLAENKRLSLLTEISRLYEVMKANREKSVDISITSAFDLNHKQQANLTRALSARLSCNVNITSMTDSSLLGGVIVRSDDWVIDGSVRGKLSKLAEAITA
jgi:F-type H+-transporting ATPase subunit delta